MTNFRKTNLHLEHDISDSLLTLEQLERVDGGRDGQVVIVGCTTRPPLGGYPPGTIIWNPWIGQPYPQPT